MFLRLFGKRRSLRNKRPSRSPSRRRLSIVEALERREYLTTSPMPMQFDFGTATSPVAAGYTQVSDQTKYSVSQGYGWISGSIGSRDMGAGATPIRYYDYTTDGTFAVDLPNGYYSVTLATGYAASSTQPMDIILQGAETNTVTTAYANHSYGVAVSNGQLDVRLTGSGANPWAEISSLTVASAVPTPQPAISGAPISGRSLEGFPISLTASASEAMVPGATFTYAWQVLKDGAAFASATAPSLSLTPAQPGTYQVSLTATDQAGTAATTTQTITVDQAYQFDFGTSTSPVASGFTQVTDATKYSAPQGYGWSAGSIGSRDMGSGDDLTRDFNYTTDGTFAVDVPNGAYNVTLSTGYTTSSTNQMGVYLQGSEVATPTTAFARNTYAVDVLNGQIDLRLTGIGQNPWAIINGLIIIPVAPPQQVDESFTFATPTAPAVAGSTPVSDQTKYAASQGYGWTSGDIGSRDMGPGATPIRYYDYTTDGTFAVDVPDGFYNVTLATGYASTSTSPMEIFIQGALVDTVTTAYANHSYGVAVSNGQLDVRLTGSGANPWAEISAMSVVSAVPTPQPVISGAPPSGHALAGSPITLSASATEPMMPAASFTYAWQVLKDGAAFASGNTQSLSFDPAQPGSYQVSLTATDQAGAAATATKTIVVDQAYQFDFGTSTSPVASGFMQVTEATTYGAAQGYGWSSGSIGSRDMGSGDDLTRDYNYTSDGTFAIDLPDGSYDVTLSTGYTNSSTNLMDVYMQGSQVDTVTTAFAKNTYAVNVANGRLDVRLTGDSQNPYAVINGLMIYPAGTVADASINGLPQSGHSPEGSPISLSASTINVPGATGSYQYAWSVLKNNVAYATGSSSQFSFTPDDNATYQVSLTVSDSAGVLGSAAKTLLVDNVPPQASLQGPSMATVNSPVSFVGTATDASPVDTAAGFTYAWNFGDGSTATGPVVNHTYTAAGTYTVSLTATDKDGGQSTAATSTVTVTQHTGIADVGLTTGWATFGEGPPQGAAFSGLQVGNLPTQTDIKTRWPDGSIRFAIVTVDVPVSGTYVVTAAGGPDIAYSGDPGVVAPQAPLDFDFGTSSSPVAPGYTQVSEATRLGAGDSYGWQMNSTVNSYDRGTSDLLTRAFDYTPDGTFGVKLPNGSYTVTITVGDANAATQPIQMSVYLQGTQVDSLDNAAGSFTTHTYSATVSNGELDLRLLGVNGSYAAIDALAISPSSPAAATAPAAPVGLVATALSSSLVQLNWVAADGAADYTVERSTDGANWGTLGSVTTNSYEDSGLESGSTYYYRVIASNSAGTGPASAAAEATTAFAGAQNPNVSVQFTIGSTVYTATLPINPSSDLWLAGPLAEENRTIVTPIAPDGTPHPFLRVYFDTRNFAGGGSRVDVDVENDLNATGDTSVTYSVDILVNGQVAYHHDTITQYYMTRWHQVVDAGVTESQVTPDFTPFQQSGTLPTYLPVVQNLVDSPTGPNFDILQSANLSTAMAAGGGRPEIAPYPDWAARYIVYKNPTEGQYVMANGDLAGSWPVHLREPDGTFITIDSHPFFAIYPNTNPDATVDEVPLGDQTATGPLLPDTAHTPSLAFIPYLVTGDRYYADEMTFWGVYGLDFALPYARQYNLGLVYPGREERTLAWQLRNMADPAAYLPQADPMRDYFASKAENNLNWADAYAESHNTPLGSSFEATLTPEPIEQTFQSAYLVWSIIHANDLGFSGGDVAKSQIDAFFNELANSPDFDRNGLLTMNLQVGTFNPDGSIAYYSTVKQLFDANYPNGVTETSPWYSQELRVIYASGLRDNLPGASGAYDWIYPTSVNYISGSGAGWAVNLS